MSRRSISNRRCFHPPAADHYLKVVCLPSRDAANLRLHPTRDASDVVDDDSRRYTTANTPVASAGAMGKQALARMTRNRARAVSRGG